MHTYGQISAMPTSGRLALAEPTFTELISGERASAEQTSGEPISGKQTSGGPTLAKLTLAKPISVKLTSVEPAYSGLQTVQHRRPSYISIDTIYRSEGQIPEDFLRGAGVPDTFIAYMRSLIIKPIDYYTCFIYYSSKDEAFAQRLFADLQYERVRCWLAPEPMQSGDKIRYRIDESIRFYDKLLLVLSEHSIASTWVQHEVEAAFEKERQRGGQVLFPFALDDAVQHTARAWAATIRRRKHIGDFTRWKQHDDYQRAFERLLQDLKAEA